MKDESRIEASIELLSEIEESNLPADVISTQYFRARRYIGSKDRRRISEIVFAIIRNRLLIRHLAGEKSYTPRLAVMIYLIALEKESKDDVDALFSGDHHAPEQMDTREFEIIKQLSIDDINDLPENIRFSIPDWAFTRINEYFEKPRKEFAALNQAASLDLRVNTLKSNYNDVCAKLKEYEFEFGRGKYSPWCIRMPRGKNLSDSEIYRDGMIEVQDEGSQLIAVLVDAKPGDSVFDMCAGAGGKTLAIGAMMQNKGRLIAGDINDGRLDQLTARAKRAGLTNLEKRYTGSKDKKWIKRQEANFDKVLLDVPCTGTGTWRRNPDLKWRFNESDLQEIMKKQKSILGFGAKLVKPGGRLVYSTCSIMRDENETQIEKFLEQNPDFSLFDISGMIPGLEGPYLRLTPAQHQTDGFFGAVLIKSAAIIS